MEWVALGVALLSIIGSIFGTVYSSNKQAQHDEYMAEMNKQNQKELMDYQTELSQNTNTISTQTGHAAAAGVSPALLYGGMQTPSLVNPSASNTGNASQLEPLRMFDKLPTSNVVETIFTKRKQDMELRRLDSDIAEARQRTMESASRTAENLRNTAFQRSIEKTIFDQQMANLHLTQVQGENLEFITQRGRQLLPGELVAQGLINRETEAKIEKTFSDISVNNWEMSQIRKDIERMDSVIGVNDAQKNNVIESTKKSAIGRVMQEFGLTSHLLPAQLRSASELHKALNNEQMKGAYITLRELGFSEHEASNAVIYYTAKDPKDATPSVLNSASRILSALVRKK